MKKTFLAHAAAEGYNPSDTEVIYSLLGTMIIQNTDHTYSYGNGLTGVKTGGKSGRSSGLSTGNDALSLMSLYFNNFQVPQLLPISGQTSNQLLMAPGHAVPILSEANKVMAGVPQEVASDRYSRNNELGLINPRLPIYFGSNNITKDQLKNIGLDLTKGSQIVYLPQLSTGVINWALLTEVNNKLKAIYARDDFNQMTEAQKDQVLKHAFDNPSNDLQGVFYNPNTHQIEYTNTKAYITYYGLTSSANDLIGNDTATK